jgi:pentatricopeptide repeat protein
LILEKYWELLRKIDRLYEAGNYTEIIDYFKTTDIEFPYGKTALYYSWICATTKLGQFEEAIQILKQIIDEGGWYSEYILTQSPSLKPLQDIPEFKDQLRRSNKISIPAFNASFAC